ncbi:hypothetical protein BJ165DRAFT_1512741 [Panaeolus papilionaceus]|nr:hypothetical protein BJ165DRAFT_1512741 [Panaeolus papilionaceus]
MWSLLSLLLRRNCIHSQPDIYHPPRTTTSRSSFLYDNPQPSAFHDLPQRFLAIHTLHKNRQSRGDTVSSF